MRSYAACGALAGILLFARVVAAQPSEGDLLFQEGRALMLANHFAEACAKLEESQKIEPRGGTLLNLAACHERMGRFATALAEFRSALAAAQIEGREERVALAAERIEKLSPLVSALTLDIPRTTDTTPLHVFVDGNEIATSEAGTKIVLDPGRHRISATRGSGSNLISVGRDARAEGRRRSNVEDRRSYGESFRSDSATTSRACCRGAARGTFERTWNAAYRRHHEPHRRFSRAWIRSLLRDQGSR